MTNNHDLLREISRKLYGISEKVEAGSALWESHPELHESFQTLYNNSVYLTTEINSLFRNSMNNLGILQGVIARHRQG